MAFSSDKLRSWFPTFHKGAEVLYTPVEEIGEHVTQAASEVVAHVRKRITSLLERGAELKDRVCNPAVLSIATTAALSVGALVVPHAEKISSVMDVTRAGVWDMAVSANDAIRDEIYDLHDRIDVVLRDGVVLADSNWLPPIYAQDIEEQQGRIMREGIVIEMGASEGIIPIPYIRQVQQNRPSGMSS